MTTRKSKIETEDNQRSAFSDNQRTVLITDSRKAEKFHRALAGTLTSCGRTNADFQQHELGDVSDEYEPCAKCFDLPGGVPR